MSAEPTAADVRREREARARIHAEQAEWYAGEAKNDLINGREVAEVKAQVAIAYGLASIATMLAGGIVEITGAVNTR